ncbi:WecB/TagA/CpsF family glycosyltransferase [Listeria booriae]|uniref:WecB/TagA/CpsF family glycosyltransferase n=1 Tax=Listeria booriae TaxID=1552123 RepID=A0A7X0WT80_9LIST|nr:WecB/TagA/CpsF family glycosyltransferase [Listeria booriae]MBC1230334.1 WecB/TagA/CpsF family glycosyltransferase [Listeria booriae]MBC1316803.1 WecB/TagA/CpsF family glycosyltransferase [Listeria booriae]MBC1359440.1 WecB/TagA/CpsF family glycosyltransferase [Listeria booriae]MBC2002564.1 WecB/TagA/CpsF family glycosyltransferase [Listeria booriae]MBC6298959.1 WecB/TagA/CpsF family glycosyltransferase [Listeria booriae]
MTQRIQFLEANLDTWTFNETIDQIETHIHLQKPIHHTGINADKINLMKKNPRFKKIINDAALINPDGMSVVLAAKLCKQPQLERVAGIDIMIRMLEIAATKGYRVYFLGTSQPILEKLIHRVNQDYPTLTIAGYHHGFFQPEEEARVVTDVRNSQADLLFIALPSPQKEFFVDTHMNDMNVPVSIGVGGSFDVIAGEIKRAPRWMQKCSLEWFYRMIQEPKRLGKRYLIGNTVFLGHVLQAKMARKSEV